MNTKFEELRIKVAAHKQALGVPAETGQPTLGVSTNQAPAIVPQGAPAPAAPGAGQPASGISSPEAGPAPTPIPPVPGPVAGAPNTPPAAQGGTDFPADQMAQIEAENQQIDQQVAQQELATKKVEGEAKLENSLAKGEGANVKLLEAKAKREQASIDAQQYYAQSGQAPPGQGAQGATGIGGAPGAEGDPGGGSPMMQQLMQKIQGNKVANRRPLNVKEASVRVKINTARNKKYAEVRYNMATKSAMAEVLFKDIPHSLIEQGCGLDPLTDTDMRLIAFGLKTGGAGRMIDMINQRQHNRAKVVKVAAGDMEAYRDVLRRGTALHRAIVKVAESLFTTVESHQAEAGLGDREYVVKLATERITPASLLMQQLHAVVMDDKIRKTASGPLPKMSIKAAAERIDKWVTVIKCAANKNVGNKPVGVIAIQQILADQPELRKAANIAAFDAAGAAALVNNDMNTLAKCVMGLALEGRLGSESYTIATT